MMMVNALLYYLLVINILTFVVFGIDKRKAKQGSWRISEATLLMLAVIGGTIGALLGMQVWPTSDSVGSDCLHIFDKREIEIP